MCFADSIKFVRLKLNLSQEDLARAIGVSFATVNRWEKGTYNPSRLAKKSFEIFCKNNNVEVEVKYE